MYYAVTGILLSGSGATLVSTVGGWLAANAAELLIILGGLFGISIVMALLDIRKENNWLAEKLKESRRH